MLVTLSKACLVRREESIEDGKRLMAVEDITGLLRTTQPKENVSRNKKVRSGKDFIVSQVEVLLDDLVPRIKTSGGKQGDMSGKMEEVDEGGMLLKKRLAATANAVLLKSTKAAGAPKARRTDRWRACVGFSTQLGLEDSFVKESDRRGVFFVEGERYVTAGIVERTGAEVGEEGENQVDEGLRQFALQEALRGLEAWGDAGCRELRTDEAGRGAVADYDDSDDDRVSSEAKRARMRKRLVASHVSGEAHQGAFPLSWAKMRRKRAELEFAQTVGQSAGLIKRGGLKETGTDIENATRQTLEFVRQELPGIDSPWNQCLELKEELWEAVARLDSPRRRAVWGAISELDAVLPAVFREKKARAVQNAYRCHLARREREKQQLGYFFRMVVTLQRNIKVAAARRALPKRRREIAESLVEAKNKAEKEARVAWLKSQTPAQVAHFDLDERVRWLMLQAPKVAEAMVRTLLTITEGDPAKALGLCGVAAGVPPAPAGKLPLKK